MANDRIQMPTGQGGLVRYFDEYKSKLALKPAHVIVLGVLVVIFMALLHSLAKLPA